MSDSIGLQALADAFPDVSERWVVASWAKKLPRTGERIDFIGALSARAVVGARGSTVNNGLSTVKQASARDTNNRPF